MKKRCLVLFLVLLVAAGSFACGKKPVETQAVDYAMTFENQTGIDISKLEIRHAEDAEWSEIFLSDGIWENGYRIPVSMQGQMPIAENGWQVQATFDGSDTQKVWSGVEFGDALVFSFSLADKTYEPLVTVREADALAE
jgi:hypothetical protein